MFDYSELQPRFDTIREQLDAIRQWLADSGMYSGDEHWPVHHLDNLEANLAQIKVEVEAMETPRT